ncbi:MAG: hypothetical protein QME25_03825, partial [Bacteroidota bacterium]|nr:hypothetical protein [Bacteroidota bacterium]
PCGSVKNGSSYEETAKLELAEEAGVERGLKDVFVPHDDTEEFEKVTLPISEVESKIKSNEIWDGMSLAAWLIAKDHL